LDSTRIEGEERTRAKKLVRSAWATWRDCIRRKAFTVDESVPARLTTTLKSGHAVAGSLLAKSMLIVGCARVLEFFFDT
jgi:hypothetical protein